MAHKSIVDRVLMLAAAVCAAALVWQLTVLLTSKRTPSIGRAVAMSAPAAADDPAAPAPAAVAAVAPSPAVRIVYPGADTGKTSLKATDLPAAPLAALTTPAATVPASGFVQAAPASAGPPQDGASPPGLPSTQIVDGRPAQPAASAEGPGSTEPDQAGLTATRASVDVAAAEAPAPADAAGSAADAKPGPDGTVDLNHASAEALNHLKGAGRIGQAIVSHRPYRSVEDLMKKRVLRRDVYEQIKQQVAIQQ